MPRELELNGNLLELIVGDITKWAKLFLVIIKKKKENQSLRVKRTKYNPILQSVTIINLVLLFVWRMINLYDFQS